jgi:uncharacterized membrane protein YedE/YeeE
MTLSSDFTPLAGLAGGVLIGAASAGLLLANGRIAGVSGILGGSLRAAPGDLGWRLAFLIALPLGAGALHALQPAAHDFAITSRLGVLSFAGLLVGFGTQLGSGCTSGHGVCGLARGSRRSLAATATFMLAGAATLFVVRHVLGGL